MSRYLVYYVIAHPRKVEIEAESPGDAALKAISRMAILKEQEKEADPLVRVEIIAINPMEGA